MDSSSDEEGIITHRKSKSKTIFESDDDESDQHESLTTATEDFKLHISDAEDEDIMENRSPGKGLNIGNSEKNFEGSGENSLDSSIRNADSSKVDVPEDSENSNDTTIKNDISMRVDASKESEDSNSSLIRNSDSLRADVLEDGENKSNNKTMASAPIRGTEDIMRKLNALADSDSESDVDGDLDSLPNSTLKSKFGTDKRHKSSSDSDSDSSFLQRNRSPIGGKSSQVTTNDSKERKKKPGPERKSKTVAKNAMLEIKAESQRQLRQSKVGLPYHIPKQRPLSDFLNRRKSLPNMPIKGPAEQLAVIWKKIEAREKEVEEFYKSDSDVHSDSDNERCGSPESQNINVAATESKETINALQSEERESNSENDIVNSGIECSGDSGVAVDVPSTETESTDETIVDSIKSLPESSQDSNLKPNCDILLGEPLQCNIPFKADKGCVDASKLKSDNQLEISEPSTSTVVINEKESDGKATSPTEGTSKTLSSLCTQDSQDVSLHYSETQWQSCDDLKDSHPQHESSDIANPDVLETNYASVKTIDLGDNIQENVSHESNKEGSIVEDTHPVTNGITTTKHSLTWDELKAKMTFSDEDFETEDPLPEEKIPKKSIYSSHTRLSLKGSPNDVIDLDNMNCRQSRTPGVQDLIERFMQHSAPKKQPSKLHTVELSLISSETNNDGGVVDIKHESLKIVLAGEDDARSDNQKPGARLKLLKDELYRQMRKQKEEEWSKKLEEMKNEQSSKGEKDDCGMLPDEEEEEEMTDSETESEPEINDVRETKRKKKSKSLFVDEEAEVEDDDGVASADEGEESNDDDDGVSKDDDDEEENDFSDGDIDDKEEKQDIEEESNITEMDDKNLSPKSGYQREEKKVSKGLPRKMTSDMFSSQSTQSTEWHCDDDDDFIPAGQPNGVVRREPLCENTDDAKEDTIMFSPISLSIPLKTPSFLDTNSEGTPTKFSWMSQTQSQAGIKNLFTEPEISTQEKMDDLASLFGEKFNDSSDALANLVNTASTADSESDLMALCSGKFVTQPPQSKDLEEGSATAAFCSDSPFVSQTQGVDEQALESARADEDSQDISLKWNEDRDSEDRYKESKKASKAFELEIMSSDEDDEFSQIKEKKKKNRKLNFSDDEDDVGNQEIDDNEHSDGSETEHAGPEVASERGKKDLFGVFLKPTKEVFYDSDENEIEPGDFLDKEAELSDEEDWQGSEDEDEKGLDQLEMDEADKEDIDQDLVREQLVKNHMQKMLDEDRRDVRILQEMLLEDGELHSDTGGRERQFRWRNVDSLGMGDDAKGSDEEHADNEEEEDDAEWRKKRHEREMFLKEQREKQMKEVGNAEDADEILENSELLKLGKAVLFKSRSNSLDMSGTKETPVSKTSSKTQLLSPDGKRPNMFVTKRGSFLSRGENVLAKLAKMTGPAKENVLVGAKNSGNFVFAAVSPPKIDSQKIEETDSKAMKRKASVTLASSKDKKPCLLDPAKKRSALFDHL